MKLDYMKNLEATMIACNRKAFLYRDGKAWDNRKCKTFLKHAPRGKVYVRLKKLEDRKQFERLIAATEKLAEVIKTGA